MWFAPAGRYLLPFSPVLMALAAERMVGRRWLTVGVLTVSAAGLLLMSYGFASVYRLNW
jgi:hypothetical protein